MWFILFWATHRLHELPGKAFSAAHFSPYMQGTELRDLTSGLGLDLFSVVLLQAA